LKKQIKLLFANAFANANENKNENGFCFTLPSWVLSSVCDKLHFTELVPPSQTGVFILMNGTSDWCMSAFDSQVNSYNANPLVISKYVKPPKLGKGCISLYWFLCLPINTMRNKMAAVAGAVDMDHTLCYATFESVSQKQALCDAVKRSGEPRNLKVVAVVASFIQTLRTCQRSFVDMSYNFPN
jgi:hypothetical protein